jgi:hypothetical protein
MWYRWRLEDPIENLVYGPVGRTKRFLLRRPICSPVRSVQLIRLLLCPFGEHRQYQLRLGQFTTRTTASVPDTIVFLGIGRFRGRTHKLDRRISYVQSNLAALCSMSTLALCCAK